MGNEVLRIEKHSNMDNEMIEEAPSTEPKKLRITTSDLMSGFHESPVNIEMSLEKILNIRQSLSQRWFTKQMKKHWKKS